MAALVWVLEVCDSAPKEFGGVLRLENTNSGIRAPDFNSWLDEQLNRRGREALLSPRDVVGQLGQLDIA
jgi:hypothetical protein